MRKFFFILIALCLILTSCSTKVPNLFDLRQIINELDASYAMTQAINTAQENAISNLYSYIEKDETFIPTSYQVLNEYKSIVPGLESKLKAWKESFSAYLLDNMKPFVDQTNEYVSSLEFTDPISFVSSSTTSASEYYKDLYSDNITNICFQSLQNADYSLLNSAVKQYNSYIQSLNYFDNKNDKLLQTIDNESYFTELLCSYYFEYLSFYEDIFRTTPSAYADERVVRVFGIY